MPKLKVNISRLKSVDEVESLKTDDDKTELLVISSRPNRSQSLDISVKVGDQHISPSDGPPKNLGGIFQQAASEIMLIMCVDR